jgi:O-antigen/teichoic acid export membrane protein/rubredoxin
VDLKTMVKCRACGYIMAEGDVKDLCPACGMPKTVFEPYKEKVAERRKNLINLHMHPIVVHFPPVVATAIVGGLFLASWVGEPWRGDLLGAVELSILFMPASLIAALASGLFDGKLRFKKVTTPLLIRKMIAGGIFFGLSLVIVGLWGLARFDHAGIMMALGASCLGCNTYLGRVGATLIEPMLPG